MNPQFVHVSGKASTLRSIALLPITWSRVTRSSQPCHLSPPQNGHAMRAPRLRRKSKMDFNGERRRAERRRLRRPRSALASSVHASPAFAGDARERPARAASSSRWSVVSSSSPWLSLPSESSCVYALRWRAASGRAPPRRVSSQTGPSVTPRAARLGGALPDRHRALGAQARHALRDKQLDGLRGTRAAGTDRGRANPVRRVGRGWACVLGCSGAFQVIFHVPPPVRRGRVGRWDDPDQTPAKPAERKREGHKRSARACDRV